jgi:hypothetical protein
MPRPQSHLRSHNDLRPIAALFASSLFPPRGKLEGVRRYVANNSRNKLVLPPRDGATIRHSARNISTRTATPWQTFRRRSYLPWTPPQQALLLRPGVGYASNLDCCLKAAARKSPAPVAASQRIPNAGLVSLTMTCLAIYFLSYSHPKSCKRKPCLSLRVRSLLPLPLSRIHAAEKTPLHTPTSTPGHFAQPRLLGL